MSSMRFSGPGRVLAALLMLVPAWLATHGASAPVLEALAYLLPALALLAVLHARCFPGERALLAAIETRHDRTGHDEEPATAPGTASRALFPRGGRLMGCSLAVRPPPRAAASPV